MKRILRAGAAVLVVVLALPACSSGAAQPVVAMQEHPTPPPPDPRVMVVSANLRESHRTWPDDVTGEAYADLASMTELSNFVDHVAANVPRAPDVLLLQELVGRSARETARQLTKEFRTPYSVVIVGDNSNQVGVKGDDFKHKRNTVIVVNDETMDVVGKVGFMTLTQRPGDWPVDRFGVAQELAHALLRHRESGAEVAAMSIHWATNPKFNARKTATWRRVEWSRQVTEFMATRFRGADIRVMGGEFNILRCRIWIETRRCDEHPAYDVITEAPASFNDAVLAAHGESPKAFLRQISNRKGDPHRIDYIFATGEVYAAGRSVDYMAPRFTPRFFSDHKYDYALIGR